MNEQVAKAVAFLLQNPKALVSEFMAAVQVFSKAKCANDSLQQQIRWPHKKQCAANVPKTVGNNNPHNLLSLTNPSFQSASSDNNDDNSNNNNNTNISNNDNHNVDTEAASALLQLSSILSAI